MRKPRLFISHASGGLPDTDRVVRVRQALYDRLNGTWDVFLDREVISGGQRWRAKILDGLAVAQAAIVLFDERAIGHSDWVRAEALVLCFKKSRDPKFQLVPVLFDGHELNSAAFADYEPFELNEIQAISDDLQLSPEAVADRVVNSIDVSHAESVLPGRGWVEEVFAIVKEDANALLHAANALAIDSDALASPTSLRRAVVQHLHQAASLQPLIGVFNDLMTPMSPQEQMRFADYVFAKWVPNRAVEILLAAARAPSKRGLVALNTTECEVLKHYELRSRIEMKPVSVRWVGVAAATGDDDQAMVDAAKDAIRATLFRGALLLDESTAEPLSLEESVRVLLAEGDMAVVCTLPPRFARQPVLDRLRTDLADVVFLITQKTTADLEALTLKGVLNLTPLLDASRTNDLTKTKAKLSPIQ